VIPQPGYWVTSDAVTGNLQTSACPTGICLCLRCSTVRSMALALLDTSINEMVGCRTLRIGAACIS
jgi:hypothetical protein